MCRYAAELGLDVELVELNMRAGDHKSDWFLKINPFGKASTLLRSIAIVTLPTTGLHCPASCSLTSNHKLITLASPRHSITSLGARPRVPACQQAISHHK